MAYKYVVTKEKKDYAIDYVATYERIGPMSAEINVVDLEHVQFCLSGGAVIDYNPATGEFSSDLGFSFKAADREQVNRQFLKLVNDDPDTPDEVQCHHLDMMR